MNCCYEERYRTARTKFPMIRTMKGKMGKWDKQLLINNNSSVKPPADGAKNANSFK